MAIESQAFTARDLTADVEVYSKTANSATAGDWDFIVQVGDGTGSGDDPEKAASTLSIRVTVNGEVRNGGQQNVAKDAFASDTPIRLRTHPVYVADGETLTIDLESNNANDTAVKVAVTPRQVLDVDNVADILLDQTDGIETSVTVRQAVRLMAAVLAGKVSGAGSGLETFRGLDGSTTRVQVTTDATGNRTNVTYSA